MNKRDFLKSLVTVPFAGKVLSEADGGYKLGEITGSPVSPISPLADQIDFSNIGVQSASSTFSIVNRQSIEWMSSGSSIYPSNLKKL